MRSKRFFRPLPSALTVILTALFLTLLAQPVQAKASTSVKYDSEENCYYLRDADKNPVTVSGMYYLNTKANGKKFSGIYFVSAEGRISTGSGIHYVEAKKIKGKQYNTGYHYFAKGGKLAKKAGVLYCSNVTVGDVTFDGYYYYNANARIHETEYGLIYLNLTASDGRKFKGYYYREAMSRLSLNSALRNITRKYGVSLDFQGYRFFEEGGKMSTAQTSRYLNLVCGDVTYEGYYCFGGPDGEMTRKPGLVTADRNVYYYVVDDTGKCLTGEEITENGFTYVFNDKGVGKRTNSKLSSLEKKLKKQIRGYGGTWCVYVKRLDNNDSVTINNKSLYAASLIKVYVMASLYNQIKKGTIKSSGTLTSLTRSMITVSSNDACNELVKRQTNSHSFSKGRSAINKYISNNGYTKTSIHHTLHPSSHARSSDGKSNVTSVKDCGAILESIYRGTCVNRKYSKQMLKFLLAQQRRWKIPAGLPSGTKVANKTGETSSSDHDIAIVYSPKCTYILCVMSQNAPSSSSRIASISRTVYRYFN